MSTTQMDNDGNWPNKGAQTLIGGPCRPALARVWHGMLLLMTTQGTPAKPAPVLASLYDPYSNGFSSFVPQAGGVKSVAAPALLYSGLFTWLFYSDGTNFVCASAPQPSLNSQTNQIQFGEFQFGSPTIVAANTTANNPTAIIFNGLVYVFWTNAPQPGSPYTISFAIAPYTPGNNAITAPALAFGPVTQLGTFATPSSEPAFAVYNGQLYCAYNSSNGIQVVTLSPSGNGFQIITAPNQVAAGGPMACTNGPALAADPKGTFLTIVYCQSGGKQLCTSYLPSGVSSWSMPQLISGQSSNHTPSLITTPGNRAYVGYSRSDGNGTNLTGSDYLPSAPPD